jgi:hypothetical protein
MNAIGESIIKKNLPPDPKRKSAKKAVVFLEAKTTGNFRPVKQFSEDKIQEHNNSFLMNLYRHKKVRNKNKKSQAVVNNLIRH